MTSPAAKHKPFRVAIVGGGISGLAAAFYLNRLVPGIDYVLLEAGDRLGGVIDSLHVDGSLVEKGADNFATLIPDALQLSQDAGLAEQLIRPNPLHRLARIVADGRIYPIPNGFALMQPTQLSSIFTTPILSWAGRCRLLGEFFVPPRRDDTDESLEAFATRRLGREAYERLVEPIVGGIFTAQASTLSMQAALPQFVEMERKYGGLIRAHWLKRRDDDQASQAARRASGARYDQFVSHRDGMKAWVDAIAAQLPGDHLRLQHRVESLVPFQHPASAAKPQTNQDESVSPTTVCESAIASRTRWIVTTRAQGGHGSSTLEETLYDAVIVACPAKPAAEILRSVSPPIAAELSAIPYADSAVVAMLIDRADLDPKLHCFGLVVPQREGMDTLAISFTSEKYAGRTPPDKILLRIFMGGAVRPELVRESDEELYRRAWRDCQGLLGLKQPPSWHQVIRWLGAMPQYVVGHNQRLRRIDDELQAFPSLALAGNAYRGVGIPQCVRSGRQAAERIASYCRSLPIPKNSL
jgi:oxygen-dependent protoporphyrinogen oxidase